VVDINAGYIHIKKCNGNHLLFFLHQMFHEAEVFHDFTQYLQKNYGLYLKNRPRQLSHSSHVSNVLNSLTQYTFCGLCLFLMKHDISEGGSRSSWCFLT
jgi:hypothetical protein